MKACLLTGVRRTARLSREILSNLWKGFTLLLFMRRTKADFAISAATFWGVVLVLLGTYFCTDYYFAKPPRIFDLYALQEKAVWCMLVLLAGFIAALLAGMRAVQWTFPVIFLSAVWVPVIAHGFILALAIPDDDRKLYEQYRELMYIALFVIAMRSLVVAAPGSAARQLAGALAATGVFYLGTDNFSYSSFWYQDYKATQKKQERRLLAEDVLSDQFQLLDRQLGGIAPRHKGRNFYVVTVGSNDELDVFMKEALFAREVLAKKFNAEGHSVTLINNPVMLEDFPQESINGFGRMLDYLAAKGEQKDKKAMAGGQRFPLATTSNLNRALTELGKKADPKEDVLVLYITSHGSENARVSVELSGVPLAQITSERLGDMLDKSGFRNRVLLISACFSGSFVEKLKNDYTLIMTSSRDDRVSYGCGKNDELTYFGRALLQHAMAKTDSVIGAFELARENIEHQEEDAHIRTHSQPQLYVGRNVREFLK